ncbi:hypothetical protein [Streptomyces sp. NRRL S-237]|uniref:hypothetical protein n=1 Tax=Streptomyces sp. NRRL S-237 TaxID=1463895 RepID=UPI00068D2609|nr:hypothetical protein [Streptomyces sp. NRRL S-237]
MLLPAEAAAATTRIDVVRITAGPEHHSGPMTGPVVGHWEGPAVAEILTTVRKIPTADLTLCVFAPGWGLHAYADPAEPPLYEAAFCYGSDMAWLWGPRVPEPLHRQTFAADSPHALFLRMRMRAAGPQ